MKKPAPKKPNDYPRICLRIDAKLLSEVDAVKEATRFSYGQIVAQALRRYLPEVQKFHAVEVEK